MEDWRRIREDHGPLVWSTVYRILGNFADASDCFQDVFAELLESPRRQNVRNWGGYLRWLAVRRSLDRLRKRRADARRFASEIDFSNEATTSAGPAAEAEQNELIDRVRSAAARLPGNQGVVFWMVCVEQMSYAEVGEQLGIAPGHVGVLVHRARKTLREALADLNPARRID